MNKPSLSALAVMTVLCGVSYGQNRYVSTTGNDATNDCTNSVTPCATLQHAYSTALEDDSILVFPGNYALSSILTLAKDGIVLAAQTPSDKPVITTSQNDFIVIDAENVSVNGMKFDMGLTASSGMRGVVSTGNYNNLELANNEFNSVKPEETGMIFGAYAVFLTQPMLTVDVPSVTITDNSVTAATGMDMPGRGFALGHSTTDGPMGVVSGNTVKAYYPLQAVRIAGDLLVTDNTFSGITMLNYPLLNADLNVSANVFDGIDPAFADDLYAIIEIRSMEEGTVILAANEIKNYTRNGVISMASKNVEIVANIFTPHAAATDYISLMANTKLMTNGIQGNTFSDEITVVGNTFNAATALNGTAILIADHYGVNSPAFADITIGGAGTLKNTFAANNSRYIVLDGQAGASTAYPLWADYPATTMVPVSMNVNAYAANNIYNQTTLGAIESRNTDEIDNSDLGKVVLMDADGDRYVSATGIDIANTCTDENFPCATIANAYTVAAAYDSIFVADGEYALAGTWNIAKEGLAVTAWDMANKPVITSDANEVITVSAPEVHINGLILEMGLTSTTGFKGIVSTDNYNNLQITNNEFVSTAALTADGMAWGSYAVNVSTAAAATDTVEITGNVVTIAGAAGNVFSRGFGLGLSTANGPAGIVSGNEARAYYPIQAIRNAGNLVIGDNELTGITMVNAPVADAVVTLTENVFDGTSTGFPSDYYSVLDIRGIENGSVEFIDNEVNNYSTIGVLSMASKNVTVEGNVFTPLAASASFVSIMANSKLMTNGVQGNTYANNIGIKGNTFNAGAADGGTAIVYADHYGVTTPAFETTLSIGGATTGEKNIFDTDLGKYIVLDAQEGASTSFPLWAPYPATTMRPFGQNVLALMSDNTYGIENSQNLELMNTDSLDNTDLGRVILYYSTVGVNENIAEVASVYPNPAADVVTIKMAGASGAVVAIADVTGKVVYNGTVNGISSIDVADFNAGVYYVTLAADGQTYTAKIVKQ